MALVATTRTVSITPEDISSGKPNHWALCPGALAIRRAFPEAGEFVEVMQEQVMIAPSGPFSIKRRWQECEPPDSLRQFMHDFDNKRSVEPISFDLTFNLPEPTCLPPASPSSEPTQ